MPTLKRIFSVRIAITCLLIVFVPLAVWGSFVLYQVVNWDILPMDEMDNLMNLALQETRATYLVVQTHISPGWCRMHASAILSGISVVTIGFGGKYSHTTRLRWIMQYIQRKKLSDSHVVVSFDAGDSFFTSGDTMQRALKKFIANTAATSDEFNTKDVVDGKATAPLLFAAEELCWGASKWYNDFYNYTLCRDIYARAYKDAGYVFTSESHNSLEPGVSQYRYLNGGFHMSRVWALKKGVSAFHAKLATRKNFECDQSVWASVYIESIKRSSSDPPDQRLPRGLMSLDFQNTFSLHPFGDLFLTKSYRRWNQSDIDEYIATRKGPSPHFFHMVDNPSATPAIVHFPAWEPPYSKDIPRTIEDTAWVRESQHDAHSIMRSKNYLQNRATVKAYRLNGEEVVLKYGDVCPVDKVMNPSWLGSRLTKG